MYKQCMYMVHDRKEPALKERSLQRGAETRQRLKADRA